MSTRQKTGRVRAGESKPDGAASVPQAASNRGQAARARRAPQTSQAAGLPQAAMGSGRAASDPGSATSREGAIPPTTPALQRPPRKNPVDRTRQPTLPPGLRSRTAMGLAAAAAEGRFALQRCARCDTVQYPPREVCVNCLSEHLHWRDISPKGRLLVSTTLHHSNDPYFRERLPWRTGTVQLDAGPMVVAHIHGECADGEAVRMALKLDRAGQAVMVALPPKPSEHMQDDKVIREMSSDPKFRRVLVTDGKCATGLAMVPALLAAGATQVFIGDPQPWRRSAAFEALLADSRVKAFDLDVTDGDSILKVAGAIGGKVDILVNTADHERDGGLMQFRDVNVARDMFDVKCLGLMRLAQVFGGAMCGRAADGVNSAVAWVNLFSIHAQANLPARGVWSAAHAGALSMSQSLRSEFRPAGLRVVHVFHGPLDHEWEQRTPPPRVAPAAVAKAVVQALRDGLEDIDVGDVAKELRERLADNPKALERELGVS
ncbi:MAG: SDR family NAD(P)-dependent oxidoreductase [Pigmentiphaga sp.]|nr:SDR family NAD(P)-dependent oxidoreductase [Pigmentiphaga sp.]